MAKHDKVQLKREELIGNDVVLEDINPKSNTASIINDADGTDLNETINRIWNALNDKLSRIVNSVNGRTGAVVINSSDVGLGRVDNVSFADIQDWVLNRLEIEFANKRLHLFNSMDDVEGIILSNDAAYKNTPFYAKTGWRSNPHTGLPNYLSHIGYFYWDTGTDHLAYDSKAINVIGATDNSIIYNDSGVDGMYGKLRVNIWNDPTNALEIKNPDAAKNNSGLWVNPAKVNAAVFFYKGCYGVNGDQAHPETNAFLDITNTAESSREVKFTIDGVEIGTLYYLNETGFKIGDIIVCQFSDENYRQGYNPLTGEYNLKTGISSLFVDTAPKIGQVTNIYDAGDLENHPRFEISFISIKPYVDFGLGYYIPDQMNNLDGTVLGVKTVTGRINDESIDSNTNMSGINIIASIANNKKEYIKNEFNTVTPVGPTKTVYRNTDIDETIDGVSSGVTIVPDMSLNVIPSKNFGKGDAGLLPNWPLKTAGDVDDRTDINEPEKDITYLGINLDKSLRYKTSVTIDGSEYGVVAGFYDADEDEFWADEEHETYIEPDIHKKYIDKPTGNVYNCLQEHHTTTIKSYEISENEDYTDYIDITTNALNTSGLKILSPTDESGNGTLGTYVPHTGGLAVNVGDFLEIGGYTSNRYYENGKVNVLIDHSQGLTNFYNHIAVKIDQQSGLAFNEGGSLTNNIGIGMKISNFNTGATDTGQGYKFIAPSINDIEPDVVETIGEISTDNINFFGGMRYIHNDEYSTIGTRINDWEYVYNGEPIRHGSEGLRITDNNVLGVQPCKDSVVIIKHLEEYVEENFGWATILPMPTIIFEMRDSTPNADPRTAIINAYTSSESADRDKLKVAERCYVVKTYDGGPKRYVYVGDPLLVGAPSINDYEPLFEFFATENEFNSKYISKYVMLKDNQAPDDWDTDWVRYYRKSGDNYIRITDVVKPTYVADTFYRRDIVDENDNPNPPNRDKIYVIGLYGTVRLMTWGPKRTLLLPDVSNSPVNLSAGDPLSDIDIVSAVDASKTLSAVADINAHIPVSITEEGLLRANFVDDTLLMPTDPTRILRLYADMAAGSYESLKFVVVKKQPENWTDSFDHTVVSTFTYTSDSRKIGMCFGRFYPAGNTSMPSEAVYWVKRRNSNTYEEMEAAFGDLFDQDTPVPFNYESDVYDGKIYTKAYQTSIGQLRVWNSTDSQKTIEPMFTDELTNIPGQPIIYKTESTIYDFESGVDVKISENRGITKVWSSDEFHNGYALAVNITDKTIVPNQNNADEVNLNKRVNGALRFCNGGGLAVRINDSNDYNPDTGIGDDDLSSGTAGLRISNANVLGIKIRPDSLDGLTFDENGNLIMTGFIALRTMPSNWSTHWNEYYEFHMTYAPMYQSDADRENRRYHVIYDDFSPVQGTVEYVLLTSQPADFDPTQYYKKINTDIYIRGNVGETWASNTWYEKQETGPEFEANKYYTRFVNIG